MCRTVIRKSSWRARTTTIARWPRGTYRFTDYLDSDGFTDDPIPLTVAITVHDDGHLTCDWTGSAPQVRAALNSTLSFTKSCTYLSVRSVLRQDVPNNAGVFRCIDVIAPEGTILNPRLPGACAARALTGYRMLDVVLGALAQALPDRVPADGEGGNTVLSMGVMTADRRPFVLVDMITGAWGGRPDRDGMEAVTNPSQNMSNSPVEVLEAHHPIRWTSTGSCPTRAAPGGSAVPPSTANRASSSRRTSSPGAASVRRPASAFPRERRPMPRGVR